MGNDSHSYTPTGHVFHPPIVEPLAEPFGDALAGLPALEDAPVTAVRPAVHARPVTKQQRHLVQGVIGSGLVSPVAVEDAGRTGEQVQRLAREQAEFRRDRRDIRERRRRGLPPRVARPRNYPYETRLSGVQFALLLIAALALGVLMLGVLVYLWWHLRLL